MLRHQPWLNFSDDLHIELQQCEAEGRDITSFWKRVQLIQTMPPEYPEREQEAARIYDELAALPVSKEIESYEPSDLASIRKVRPAASIVPKPNACKISEDELYDKVYGAWLGRCSGCLLGQPVEGWTRGRINGLLRDTGNYPLKHYISSDIPEELRKKYDICDIRQVYGNHTVNWINNVSYMPEDDDINYTIIGLKILDQYGPGFTQDNVAECWLNNLPILHVCTAERIAYRNLVNLIPPPASAEYRNPFREMIGAQIRADFFGYITPGNPELGAEMAWRDASISHVKNGIYGEMFVAAILSTASVSQDIDTIITAGLSQIPGTSRLYKEISSLLDWKNEGISWEQAIDRIHKRFDEKNTYDWVHTIPNAMIVCIGLLYGGMDFEKSIGIAVSGAFDTDCNGATVGSILGMALGAGKLPVNWIQPLNDQVKSGVDGFGMVKISDLAKKTMEIMRIISA